MEKQVLLEILRTQSILGRTKGGWDLGVGMIEASGGSMESAEDEGFFVKECLNCETVLAAEMFAAGCPNCGSKDHKDIPVETTMDSSPQINEQKRGY